MKKILNVALAATMAFSVLATAGCNNSSSSASSTPTAHEHIWGEWETVTPATCETNGTEQRVCQTDSSHVESRPINGGHDWADWIYLENATCSATGLRTRTCKRNPAHYEEEVLSIDPNAHVWRASVYEQRPTCTEGGKQQFICNANPAHRTVLDVPAQHNWSAWTLSDDPDCTQNGEKTHTCSDCGKTETQPVTKLGHAYENGKCVRCEDGPIYPTEDTDIVYLNPRDASSGIQGAGTEYERFEMKEGYYEVEIGTSGKVWLSFSVTRAGQYALYSIENSKNVTARRYDASDQYIPDEFFEAVTMDDGNFYSNVSVGNTHFNTSWRATYSLQGKRGATVKFRFVRIADAPKEAQRFTQTVVPEELKSERAPNGANGTIIRDVAYESEYFYNETDGYYYTGTKENPGNLIYMAITKTAPRLFPESSFATMVVNGGTYKLYDSTTVEGDYVFKDYAWFLTNHGGLGYLDDSRNFILNEGDPTLPCYQNYVNDDGMYPVNQELFEFLNLYVNNNQPLDVAMSDVPVSKDKMWLAACYEYILAVPGSKDFPHEVSGTFEITTKRTGQTYYKILPTEGVETTTYTISVQGETNGYLYFNDKAYENEFTETVEIGANGFVFYAASLQYNTSVTFTVTVTPVTE